MSCPISTLDTSPRIFADENVNQRIVPGDAGKQNVIPSAANPHQKDPSTGGGLGATDLQQAADNSTGAPQGPGIGEAVSGTDNALPQSMGEKHSASGGKERGTK